MGSSPKPQETTGTQTSQTLSSPSIEAALSMYMPKLMGMMTGSINTDSFAPKVAGQNQLQQAAIMSGLDTLTDARSENASQDRLDVCMPDDADLLVYRDIDAQFAVVKNTNGQNLPEMLETAFDKDIERHVIARLRQRDLSVTWHEFPIYSEVDLIGIQDDKARGFLEIKSRKPTMQQMIERFPDGVLLKRRKYEACSTLETTFNIPAWVLFAFGSGRDALAACRPHLLTTRPSILTGRRDRGLATDEEPVVLI
jgi:hypothetical protein